MTKLMRDDQCRVSLICLQSKRNAISHWCSTENGSMQAISVNKQIFGYTHQGQVELVPSSVHATGIYIFMFGICVSLFNVGTIVSLSHVDTSTHALVSTCAALLFALLLSRLTLTCLARLNGLRSLVGLTMRLATNAA